LSSTSRARIEAERARKKLEAAELAEALQRDNDTQRVEAERRKAEAQRQAEEIQRQAEEAQRQADEIQRQQRIQAAEEAARQAEHERQMNLLRLRTELDLALVEREAYEEEEQNAEGQRDLGLQQEGMLDAFLGSIPENPDENMDLEEGDDVSRAQVVSVSQITSSNMTSVGLQSTVTSTFVNNRPRPVVPMPGTSSAAGRTEPRRVHFDPRAQPFIPSFTSNRPPITNFRPPMSSSFRPINSTSSFRPPYPRPTGFGNEASYQPYHPPSMPPMPPPDTNTPPNWIQYIEALVCKPSAKDLYDGNPRGFLSFILNHEVASANNGNNYFLKLKNLFDSVTSKVSSDFEYCRMLDPVDGYQQAVDILWRKYGNPASVRESVVGELKQGPQIAKNDKAGIFALSLKVTAAHEVLKALTKRSQNGFDYETTVNSLDVITDVLARIPYYIEDYRSWFVSTEQCGLFSNMRYFLEMKTSDGLDPLVIEAIRKAKELSSHRSKQSAPNPDKSPSARRTAVALSTNNREPCFICQKSNHEPVKCKMFLSWSEQDRLAEILDQNRCFNVKQ